MLLESHMKLCVTGEFSRKHALPKKLGKWNKNGPKTVFFEFIR